MMILFSHFRSFLHIVYLLSQMALEDDNYLGRTSKKQGLKSLESIHWLTHGSPCPLAVLHCSKNLNAILSLALLAGILPPQLTITLVAWVGGVCLSPIFSRVSTVDLVIFFFF